MIATLRTTAAAGPRQPFRQMRGMLATLCPPPGRRVTPILRLPRPGAPTNRLAHGHNIRIRDAADRSGDGHVRSSGSLARARTTRTINGARAPRPYLWARSIASAHRRRRPRHAPPARSVGRAAFTTKITEGTDICCRGTARRAPLVLAPALEPPTKGRSAGVPPASAGTIARSKRRPHSPPRSQRAQISVVGARRAVPLPALAPALEPRTKGRSAGVPPASAGTIPRPRHHIFVSSASYS